MGTVLGGVASLPSDTNPDYFFQSALAGGPEALTNGNAFDENFATLRGTVSGSPTIASTAAALSQTASTLGGASTTANAAGTTPAASTTGSISDYFIRAIVVILGFIFVAIGLSMFRHGGTVIQNAKGVASKVAGR